MDLLYACFFGAGVAGFAYSRMGRRLGYGNPGNVWTVVIAVFIMTTIVAYTVFKFILNV